MVKLGDKGTHVAKIQRALNDKGSLDNSGNRLTVDGSFGRKTEESVKNFQETMGLKVTGIVDNTTAVKLGLYPSDIVAPKPVTPSVSVSSPQIPSSPSNQSSSLDRVYAMFGGKTNTMIALGAMAAIGITLAIVFPAKRRT